MKLSAEVRALIFAKLRQQRLVTNKMICRQHNISLRTLMRLRTEIADEVRVKQEMARIAPPPPRMTPQTESISATAETEFR